MTDVTDIMCEAMDLLNRAAEILILVEPIEKEWLQDYRKFVAKIADLDQVGLKDG